MIKRPFESLYPLNQNNESLILEQEWRQIFNEVYRNMLEERINALLCYGMPYLGEFELLKRFLSEDGLTVLNSLENERLAYLLKAWKTNKKRGLDFLVTYLQLLYPNNFKITQLWQETSQPYPSALHSQQEAETKGTAHWLTSRVRVEITDNDEDGETLMKYAPTLQTIVGARFVLMVNLLRTFGNRKNPNKLVLASGFSAFQVVQMRSKAVI